MTKFIDANIFVRRCDDLLEDTIVLLF